MVFSMFCNFLLSRRILFNGGNGMNVKELMDKKKGHAFAHLQEQFWGHVIHESLTFTGGNVSKAADILGVSYVTYRTWAKNTGIDMDSYKRDGISIEMQNKILAAMYECKSLLEAAKFCKVTPSTLRRKMESLGLPTDFKRKFTVAMLEGLTYRFKTRSAAADYVGVDQKTIARKFIELGVKDPWVKQK